MPSNSPDYQKEYIKKHYQANKEYYKQKAKVNKGIARSKAHTFTRRYKKMCGCVDCGYSANPIALQFDHVIGNKIANVSTMISKGVSISKIKEEIRKCEVRCANCHAIVTFTRLSG
jgi:hypothetical protein